MIDKTIIQRAQGYGSVPVNVTVKIDGATIFQGSIPTLDQPMPGLPDAWTPALGEDAWSWVKPSDFAGTCAMSVTVENGQMLLCGTWFSLSSDPATVVGLQFPHQEGEIETGDPLTQVRINGAAKIAPRDPEHDGQWVWKLVAGDEFTCLVNITSPQPDPDEDLNP